MSGGITEKKKKQKMADELRKKTRLSKPVIELLQQRHDKLCARNPDKRMERLLFREILHQEFDITGDMIMDRIFKIFDRRNDGHVCMEDWIYGLNTFLMGTFEEKIDFMFQVYDLNGDGLIVREEMFSLLKENQVMQQASPSDDDPEEGVKDLVETVLKKLDKDQDLRVCKSDFSESVKNDHLLLECLGEAFPKQELCLAYLGMEDSCNCSGNLYKG